MTAGGALPDRPAVIGAAIPRRRHRILGPLARALLHLLGWRMVGTPPDKGKFIVAAAPHTSNFDGFVFLLFVLAEGLQLHWLGKASLFRGWRGKWLRRMGGVPVNRGAASDVVQQVADEFAARERFVLVLAPEGTRARNSRWKSGFYRMAQAAGVPVCVGFLDFRTRRLGFGPHFQPSGDYEADMDRLRSFFVAVTPRHPERFALPVRLDEEAAEP